MKLLYDTQTQKLLPWPRIDDEPVVGLDAHLLEMTVVQEDQPAYDSATQRLEKTEVIDAEAQTVTRGWSVVEAPVATMTAEEHLESVGLGGNRQPTLLYLRQAGAVSAKLDATEQYLNTILAMFAADPAPRSDWPAPAYTFEETVTQAVQSLSQPSEPSEPSAPSANFA
jgi:hypothetical protein